MADQQEALLEVTGWVNKTQEKLLGLHRRREELLKGNILCVSCSSATKDLYIEEPERELAASLMVPVVDAMIKRETAELHRLLDKAKAQLS